MVMLIHDASWRCCHSSSGFSLSQFVQVIPDRLDDDQIRSINGKLNVCKCKPIFPTYTLQQKIEITDLKPFLAAENTSVLIILAITVFKNLFENNETNMHTCKQIFE